MDQLSLFHVLAIKAPSVVAFYGAGGKTALLYRLAGEMIDAGHKVLITTTTKMHLPHDIPLFYYQNSVTFISELRNHFTEKRIAFLGKRILENNKIEGIDPVEVDDLRRKVPVSILVESDGARGRPIKGYASNEPVLPSSVDFIIAVIGADALGAAASSESIHRLEDFIKNPGLRGSTSISAGHIAAAFRHMLVLGRKQAPQARAVCILNKADLLPDSSKAFLEIMRNLPVGKEMPELFLVTRGNMPAPVQIVHSPDPENSGIKVSCVILAAGSSRRMGRDKLSLPIGPKSMLEHTVDQVIASGIEEIVVVIRPGSCWPEVLKAKKCRVVENPFFYRGLAGSIRVGLNGVSARTQGVIFALADQPLVPPDIYRTLADNYRQTLRAVTCFTCKCQKGNPTLFDRRTWPALLKLTGEQGGKTIIAGLEKAQIKWIETDQSAVVMDIDTPENYTEMVKQAGQSGKKERE